MGERERGRGNGDVESDEEGDMLSMSKNESQREWKKEGMSE